jgi:hypothetical protein
MQLRDCPSFPQSSGMRSNGMFTCSDNAAPDSPTVSRMKVVQGYRHALLNGSWRCECLQLQVSRQPCVVALLGFPCLASKLNYCGMGPNLLLQFLLLLHLADLPTLADSQYVNCM